MAAPPPFKTWQAAAKAGHKVKLDEAVKTWGGPSCNFQTAEAGARHPYNEVIAEYRAFYKNFLHIDKTRRDAVVWAAG